MHAHRPAPRSPVTAGPGDLWCSTLARKGSTSAQHSPPQRGAPRVSGFVQEASLGTPAWKLCTQVRWGPGRAAGPQQEGGSGQARLGPLRPAGRARSGGRAAASALPGHLRSSNSKACQRRKDRAGKSPANSNPRGVTINPRLENEKH